MRTQSELIEPLHFMNDFDLSEQSVNGKTKNNTSPQLPNSSVPMREAVEAFQKQLIEHALQLNNGVWSQAAAFLQMDRGNLFKMGKKLGVQACESSK